MQLCVDQCGVCKGTPVDCDGTAASEAEYEARHREAATQTISDSVDRFAVRACSAPVHRKISSGIRPGFTLINYQIVSTVSLWRHTRVEFRGYLRFSVTARIWRKSWEVRLTDRPLAAPVVYNLMSLPSIYSPIRGVPTR